MLSDGSIKIHENSCSSSDLNCKCGSLPFTDRVKYLGVIFDHNFNFKLHISSLVKRLRKLFYVFRVVTDFLPKCLLRTLYFGLARSLINYGIVVWGGTFKSYLKPLKIVQNGLIKILLKKPFRFPTKLLYKEFNVCNIENNFISESCILLYKTGIHPYHLTNLASTRTALNSNISLPRVNTEFYKRNAYIKALRVLQKYKINLSNFVSLSCFKAHLATIVQADNFIL